jgi:hypothetical protein
MNLGDKFDENDARRQREINGQVKSAILLSEFEPVRAVGSAYDTMEIVEFKGSSVRVKLPQIVAELITDMDKQQFDIRVNKAGNIILLLPVSEKGHGVTTYKGGSNPCVCSPRLASMLREKSVKLPVRYSVRTDEAIYPDAATKTAVTGWVCRKEA